MDEEETISRQVKWQREQKDKGLCEKCGKKAYRKKDKVYSRCFTHLKAARDKYVKKQRPTPVKFIDRGIAAENENNILV